MEVLLDSNKKVQRALNIFFAHCKQFLSSQGYVIFPHRDLSILAVKKGGYMLLEASVTGVLDEFWRKIGESSVRLIYPFFEKKIIKGEEYVKIYLEKPVIAGDPIVFDLASLPKIAVLTNEKEANFIERGRGKHA